MGVGARAKSSIYLQARTVVPGLPTNPTRRWRIRTRVRRS